VYADSGNGIKNGSSKREIDAGVGNGMRNGSSKRKIDARKRKWNEKRVTKEVDRYPKVGME